MAIPDETPSAASVLKETFARAKSENKVALIAFHASWCGWCHKMDAVMKRPEVKAVVDKYFVVTWLTVQEAQDKKSLENPGGAEVLAANGGERQGIPYFYFADPVTGKTLVTSKRPKNEADPNDRGGNIGCPAEPFEISYFLEMVKKAVPKVSKSELAALEAGFKTVKAGG
jgi:hypothetical protein